MDDLDPPSFPAENPAELIALAKAGSIRALHVLSAEVMSRSTFRTIAVLQIFCNALSKSPPSTPTAPDLFNVVGGAEGALLGMAHITRGPSSVPNSEFAEIALKSMPDIVVWMVYFVALPLENWEDAGVRDSTHMAMMDLLTRLMEISDVVKTKITRTPGVVALLAELWAKDARSVINPGGYSLIASLALQRASEVDMMEAFPSEQFDDVVVRETIATAGGGRVDKTAKIALMHVRSSSGAAVPLGYHVAMLFLLSRGPQSALRAAILDRGARNSCTCG